MPAVEPAADEQAGGEPSADDDSWPGVAPPAGWFLQTPQPAPQPPSAASPDSDPDTASDLPGVALPAPRREPDGSWSSPLTPKPAPQPLGPTQARYGRAGGPGLPPTRPASPAAPAPDRPDLPDGAAPSPWQRSHQLWAEAGIQWEQRPAPPRPQAPRPAPRQMPPLTLPPAQPRPAAARRAGPGPAEPAAARLARPGPAEPAAIGRPGPMQVPLGAPVFSAPGVDEDDGSAPDDGPAREARWGDDRPPIWQRPPDLLSPPEDSRMRPNDTLLLDHQMSGPRRSGRGLGLLSRRAATIAVPAIVLVAVAVLALALLTGHGPKSSPLTANQRGTPANTVAPQLPLAAVTFDTYPGQQSRGVFQTVNRVVAVGSTIVTMGSQASDGVVRQQFLVSTNAGASWHLAPVRAPGGGQPALGHPAGLLAGGPGGWVAVGPQAIWTSQSGLTWTLAATHGISPQLPGDSVWVITKTADGFLAAGAAADAGSANHHATQAVIWTSRDGVTWQRMTAAQLRLAGPGETVLNISYATWRGNATVISGTVTTGRTSYDAAWLSTNDGAAWTRVTIPADHGAGTTISGLGFDGSGLLAVRPGRTASGAADGIAYFSPNGQAWQYSATIDADPGTGGWSPRVVKGSDYGFVVTGTSASGQLVAYTSTGTGTTWWPTGPLGRAATESVIGATVAQPGTIVAVGYTAVGQAGQQPVFLMANIEGSVRPISLAGVAGAVIPEMAIRGTAVADGVQIAVGSANGYPAVWRKTPGGNWTLVSLPALVAADPRLRTLTSVTHGPAWLAVGAPGPVILTSTDGTAWRVAGGNITQDLAGVSGVAATSGPAGYVIVGKLVAPGGSCVADVWWSPDLTSWTRAHDVNDATGSSQVLAVAASAHGFVSAGSHDSQPAIWTTTDGRSWKTIVLPPPDGAATAMLEQIAINGNRVVALGHAAPANGAPAGTGPGAFPFAELSVDGGATWQHVPFSSPGPDTAFTALTADSAGFAAAGLFGPTGQRNVAMWTSATGANWKPSQSSGLNGSEAWQIDALAPSGSAVTGIGSIVTQQSQPTVTFTLPAR